MTSTIELERLVRTSDLRGREGRHSRPGRLRGWLVALTVAAGLADHRGERNQRRLIR